MFEDEKCCPKRKCCIDVIIFILSILFTLVLGIIIGTVTGFLGLLGFGAFVTLAIVFLVLLLIRIIMLICCKGKKCC